MGGLGMVTLVSWVQNVGIEPLIWRNEEKVPSPTDSSWTICSSSTSLATFPMSDTPLFK
eukprot:CAMPEP_0119503842 /NCGR_PEP_ID=MMETSP1344-20130328/24887_1 /TAXON_ID=236787 /ORGANISM="Florenciella parvula, Strain CCMP2471" /LENGTH=58 /DNA_ID=CAMNT_0007540169 /DNA_START=195 /DNA_END=371 /DNA_ORIENTATION=-